MNEWLTMRFDSLDFFKLICSWKIRFPWRFNWNWIYSPSCYKLFDQLLSLLIVSKFTLSIINLNIFQQNLGNLFRNSYFTTFEGFAETNGNSLLTAVVKSIKDKFVNEIASIKSFKTAAIVNDSRFIQLYAMLAESLRHVLVHNNYIAVNCIIIL